MSMRVREYDGDPIRRRHHHDGNEDDTAAASAFAAEPECRAEFHISPTSSSPLTRLPRHKSTHLSGNNSWLDLLRQQFINRPRRVFADLFLPIGYPASVGEGYLSYQVYDSLQGICSYLRGVVATSSVLMAAGVGDAEATAMSAAVAWAMRDGLGMIGGLLFSYLASSQFDQCVKEYRLFADIINDVGLTLDMLAPYAGRSRVLYVTSVATICKTMCGMAAGATKGSITQHFAIRSNMADLNAKESTQETLVSLLGMILGIGLARYLHGLEKHQADSCNFDDQAEQEQCLQGGTAEAISWGIFVVLTLVHVYANYLGVKLLRLRTLNRERAEVVLKGIVHECAEQCKIILLGKGDGKDRNFDDLEALIPSPHDVNESLLNSVRKLFFPCGARLGNRFASSFRSLNQTELSDIFNRFADEQYVLCVSTSPRRFGKGHGIEVNVALNGGSSETDALKAFVHAMVILELYRQMGTNSLYTPQDYASFSQRYVGTLFATDPANVDTSSLPLIIRALTEKGWDCNRFYLGYGPWRVQVDSDKEE